MHDCGKSDSPIVPVKSANKDIKRLVLAEEMEERGLAKRNSCEQNRDRTQRREALQNKLARVRRDRHHLRQEPGAVVPHAGICAGGRR
jgi:hypothetical protein